MIGSTGAVHRAAGALIKATLRLKKGGNATLEVEVAPTREDSLKAARPVVTPGHSKDRLMWAAKEAVQWDRKWPFRETFPGRLHPGKGGPLVLTVDVTVTGADGEAHTERLSVQGALP